MLNLSNVLETTADNRPDETAVMLAGRRTSYRDLDAAARRLASALVARGVGPGDLVALACPNITSFPIAYFAILKAGAVVVPISLLLKRGEIAYMLGHSGATAFLCWEGSPASGIGGEGRAAFDDVAGCGTFVWIANDPAASEIGGVPTMSALIAAGDPGFDTVSRVFDDTAVVVYTSGTTGRPKGAMLTHGNIMMHALAITTGSSLSRDDIVLVVLPLFHIFGQVCVMVAGLALGATLVLLPRFETDAFIRTLIEQKVTRFSGVPTMYWALVNAEIAADDLAAIKSTLRFASCGGASLPVEILRRFDDRFGTPVLEGYGLSECSPAVTNHRPGMERKPGTVGKPMWGVQVRVVDDGGNPVPVGEKGEVVVRGHVVMKGYLNDPEATAEAFKGGWFHTGDIGVFDADGYLSIVDRKKEMLIRGGMNVYPREIEEVLITHPAVSLVAVIGAPDDRVGQEVKAVVVPKPGAEIVPEALIAWAKERMAAYKYPRIVEVRDALPMTATGKILKKALG